MRQVELRINKLEKYEIIKELVDHNGNKNRASKKLSLSRRQINCLIIKYKEKGKAGFVHGNRTRKPINALDNSISEDIILLYKNKNQDWNFYYFKIQAFGICLAHKLPFVQTPQGRFIISFSTTKVDEAPPSKLEAL